MNNEIPFCQSPRYLNDSNYELTSEAYIELDNLAKLMLNPDKNFDKLLEVWNNKEKFRIISGGLNS